MQRNELNVVQKSLGKPKYYRRKPTLNTCEHAFQHLYNIMHRGHVVSVLVFLNETKTTWVCGWIKCIAVFVFVRGYCVVDIGYVDGFSQCITRGLRKIQQKQKKEEE